MKLRLSSQKISSSPNSLAQPSAVVCIRLCVRKGLVPNLIVIFQGEIEDMRKSEHFTVVNQVPALEVARQLTLITHEMLRRVKHTELLSRRWDDGRHAPNLFMFNQFVEQVSSWVRTEIVMGATPADRAAAITYFIDVSTVTFHTPLPPKEMKTSFTPPQ